jgi:hypothetical protein
MPTPFDKMTKKELKAARKQLAKKDNPSKSPSVPRNNVGVNTQKAPINQQKSLKQSNPIWKMSKNGGVLITHSELVDTVTGTTAFNIFSGVPINPGMASFGPWISQVSPNWEKYKFNKLKFEYFTRTGTTTVGSLTGAFDYNAGDLAPVSEQVMTSYHKAKQVAPWILNESWDFDCSQVKDARYIRYNSVPAGQDIKTYDAGTFFLATQDATAAAVWGKLWVTYEVELTIPATNQAGSTAQESSGQYYNNTVTNTTPLGTFSNANIALGPIIQAGSQLWSGTTLYPAGVGRYLLDIIANGTTLPATFNLSVGGVATTPASAIVNSTSTYGAYSFILNLANELTSVQLPSLGGTLASTNLRLTPYQGTT